MRSGGVNLSLDAGAWRNAGIDGYDWSSQAAAHASSTSATAYYMVYRAIELRPSRGPLDRWLGFPLRCLSTV